MLNDEKGTLRVVWKRVNTETKESENIPFFKMSRSLGDFWSYNPDKQTFAISPIPHIIHFPLNPSIHKFFIVASNGQWNVFSSSEAVEFVRQKCLGTGIGVLKPRNIAKAIVHEALDRYKKRGIKADNISVIITYVNCEKEQQSSNDREVPNIP